MEASMKDPIEALAEAMASDVMNDAAWERYLPNATNILAALVKRGFTITPIAPSDEKVREAVGAIGDCLNDVARPNENTMALWEVIKAALAGKAAP
jgi:hypothetical protein